MADYLVIGTLESYEKMRGFYGEENLVPLYVEVEDGERLQRALARNGSRGSRNMRRCAGDSWRMRRTSLKRIWQDWGSGNGFPIEIKKNV